MEWYRIKEKSAGKKRLMITWYLYKILGRNIVLLIAFFVAIITFILNSDIRHYSKKYFEILYKYTKNTKLKPSLYNEFKQVHSYAKSLIYKMEAFGGTYNDKNINFINKKEKDIFFQLIKEKKGIICINSHVGNMYILKSILDDERYIQPSSVTIFIQKAHCTQFDDFLKTIENKNNIKMYPIEEINITTVSEIDDNLKKGGIVFIAGDRIAANNPQQSIKVNFLGNAILLPKGAFKLVEILKYNTFFVSCIKENLKYNIYFEEQQDLNFDKLTKSFVKFLEKITLKAPYQFYNFYDIFK